MKKIIANIIGIAFCVVLAFGLALWVYLLWTIINPYK